MKEQDIRPDCLMGEDALLRAEDVRQLLVRRNDFVKILCPACESPNYRTKFEKNDFTFVICAECGTVFVNPRPNFEMLSKFYAKSKSVKHWNDKVFPASEHIRRSQIFAPRAKMVVELCRKYKHPTKVLLDVGAGFGTFCEEVIKLAVFDKVIAVEQSDDLAQTCSQKGLEVINKLIEKVDLKKDLNLTEVSVITNFELIEHLYCPRDFLLECRRIFPAGGLFILTTPNIKGFDMSILGELSDNIVGPDHLNYFHPRSLSQLLERCGFEVIEIMTPGRLDAEIVRRKIIKGCLKTSNCAFLQELLINQWDVAGEDFQKFLAEHKLSSQLLVVARKMQ